MKLTIYLFTILTVCFFSLMAKDKPMNVLFIAIDDLRPELGCYGSDIVKSPNLDKLASVGMLFNKAYCQEAICGPSRASIMTGTRPDTNGVVKNDVYFRDTYPDAVTLSQYFIQHGYNSVNCGKIYHGNMKDHDKSWNYQPVTKGQRLKNNPGRYTIKENQETYLRNKKEVLAKYGKENSGGLIHGPAIEAGPVGDEAYRDGYNARLAMNTLEELVKSDKPWFMGMGFVKPHLPFLAPKKYFDLYDPKDIKLSTQPKPPINGAQVGLHASFEMRTRHGIPKYGDFGDKLSRELKHAYYACTSYVDAQIGLILDTLDQLGVRDNTAIVVWGDHGWHLGEYGIWGKATNYEIATRVPLIISTPNMKARGETTQALVELVDLYPTLVEVCGLEQPKHLEGTSLVPLLNNSNKKWKSGVFSQFPSPALREWAAKPLSDGMRSTFFGPLINDVENKIKKQMGPKWDRNLFENDLMGYAYRTDRYRLVAWLEHKKLNSKPMITELYDHKNDPLEKVNIAQDNPEIVQKLLSELRKGWRAAQP